MNKKELLNISEVSMLIDSSIYTIKVWYAWKKENPKHPMAKKLPDPIQKAPRQTRYWRYDDIWKLLDFKKSIKMGKNGFMGSITQRYSKRRKENNVE